MIIQNSFMQKVNNKNWNNLILDQNIDLSSNLMTDITEEKMVKCLYSKYDIAQLAINDALSFLLQLYFVEIVQWNKEFLNIAV